MRPLIANSLLSLVLLALLVAATAAPALAVSEVKLEVNENCVEPDWPCWALPATSQPASKVTLASGGTVAFTDHAREANIAWTASAPTCEPSVPVAPALAKTGWEGKCTFATPGIYDFESATLFKGLGLDYTKYEIEVEAPPPPPAAPTATTAAATGLHETEVTLNGKVDPEGGAEAGYWFEWGIGSGATYEHSTPEVGLPADRVQHAASSFLTGLEPSTEYHFRVVATNKIGGPIMGGDLKFKTASPAPAKKTEPPSEPPPSEGTTPAPTQPVIVSALPKPEEKLATLQAPLVAGSLKLTAPRHGATVHGSIEVSQSGAGGRLEVDLTTKGAFVSKARGSGSKRVRVGRLVRQGVPAGKIAFSVALTAQAKRALSRRHSLPLTVTLTLTPTQGPSSTIVRSVTLRS